MITEQQREESMAGAARKADVQSRGVKIPMLVAPLFLARIAGLAPGHLPPYYL